VTRGENIMLPDLSEKKTKQNNVLGEKISQRKLENYEAIRLRYKNQRVEHKKKGKPEQ